MRWDRVLDGLREAGFRPQEEEFIENYGLYAIDEQRIPPGRYLRCTRGQAVFDGIRIEVLSFPSEEEALEFLALVLDEGGWVANRGVLVRATGTDRSLLARTRRAILELLRRELSSQT
jgi:hypothetical protein